MISFKQIREAIAIDPSPNKQHQTVDSEYIYHKVNQASSLEKIRKEGLKPSSNHKHVYFWHGDKAEGIARVYHSEKTSANGPIIRIHKDHFPTLHMAGFEGHAVSTPDYIKPEHIEYVNHPKDTEWKKAL